METESLAHRKQVNTLSGTRPVGTWRALLCDRREKTYKDEGAGDVEAGTSTWRKNETP